MKVLETMRENYKSLPERDVVGRLKALQDIQDISDRVVHNLQNRNNELIVSETVQTQLVGLLMEQRFMLFTVLGDIKSALESEGRPDDPMIHMVFNVVGSIQKMDDDWKEQIDGKSIKQKQ